MNPHPNARLFLRFEFPVSWGVAPINFPFGAMLRMRSRGEARFDPENAQYCATQLSRISAPTGRDYLLSVLKHMQRYRISRISISKQSKLVCFVVNIEFKPAQRHRHTGSHLPETHPTPHRIAPPIVFKV
jgi:hypothetical protein